MEYRKRRKPNYRPKHAGGYPAIFLAAAVFIGVVYLFAASRAATYAAEHWIAPLLTRSQRATPTPTMETFSPARADTAAEWTGTLASYPCYTLQIGSYEDEENARAQSEALQKLGAAGYILHDGKRYRVLAAGYGDSESAETVRGQLAAEGIEAYVYALESPKIAYALTGSDRDVATFSDALETIAALLDALADLAIRFDRDNLDAQSGAAAARALYDEYTPHLRALEALPAGGDGNVAGLASFYATCLDGLERAASGGEEARAAFSARLKSLYLSAVEARRTLPAGPSGA